MVQLLLQQAEKFFVKWDFCIPSFSIISNAAIFKKHDCNLRVGSIVCDAHVNVNCS